MAHIPKATGNIDFSNCRYNIASFKCKSNLLMRGCNKSLKKYLALGLIVQSSAIVQITAKLEGDSQCQLLGGTHCCLSWFNKEKFKAQDHLRK